MRCSEFEAELNDLLDNRLPLQLSTNAEIHCSRCPDCQELLTGYQALFSVTPVPVVRSAKSSQRNRKPKKHFETGVRSGIALFEKSNNRNSIHALSISPAKPFGLDSKSLSSIPVAVPETATADQGSNTPTVKNERHWSLKLTVLALVPAAAAVYLLGIGLLSQIPDNIKPDNVMVATASEPDKNNLGLASAELADFDWEKTAEDWDAQWRRLAVHRAGACQMPGVQPYFYSVNGAVEALRKNVIRRDKNIKQVKP